VIRRVLRSSAIGAVVATIGLGIALVFRPVDPLLALDAYVLFVGGIALLSLFQATTSASPAAHGRSAFEHSLAPPPESVERPAELARVEREVVLCVGSAFYVHYRLRPMIREIAGQRLTSRYAVDLDEPTLEQRAMLPEEAWNLIHSDRQPPRNRHAPGIPIERLRAIVDSLERI
jgi:hypothetical protein